MRPGLALASVALGAVGLVFAFATWVTWLVVHPWGVLTSALTVIFALVLGALWVLVLGSAVLGVIFGLVVGETGRLARIGIGLCSLAALLALAGAVAFVLAALHWTPVMKLDTGGLL